MLQLHSKYNQFTNLFQSALFLIADIGFNEGPRTRLFYKSNILDTNRGDYFSEIAERICYK